MELVLYHPKLNALGLWTSVDDWDVEDRLWFVDLETAIDFGWIVIGTL